MAQHQGDSLDMHQLEILNLRLQNLASAPSTPVVGQVYVDSTNGKFYWRALSTWVDPLDRANHTGTQLAATVSNLATTVKAYRLDEFAAPNASVPMNTQKFTNLTTGSASGDSCTYGQLSTWRLDQLAVPTASVSLNTQKITNLLNGSGAQDAAAFGQIGSAVSTATAALRLNTIPAAADVALSGYKITGVGDGVANSDVCTYGQALALVNGLAWKQPVRAATTANITLSGTQTVDGVALVALDRCLVKNQSTPAQNGLYVVSAGAWSRTTDADGVGELASNTTVLVQEGTANADTQWTVSTNGAITPGVTAVAFQQIGAATSYVADGATIQLTGNSFSAVVAGNGSLTRKWAGTVGGSTSIACVHSLGTKDVTYSVRQVSDDAIVGCGAVFTDVNTITLTFAVAPTASSIRVVVHA